MSINCSKISDNQNVGNYEQEAELHLNYSTFFYFCTVLLEYREQ